LQSCRIRKHPTKKVDRALIGFITKIHRLEGLIRISIQIPALCKSPSAPLNKSKLETATEQRQQQFHGLGTVPIVATVGKSVGACQYRRWVGLLHR